MRDLDCFFSRLFLGLIFCFYMQALILAGGKGTRLRPLTVYTPKPIVPVLNRPFLLYQIDALKKADITDVTLSLSYQPDKIELLLGNGSEYGVNLRYITEPSPMGTGGAYKFAGDALRETTVVINGDILTNLDIRKVINFHRGRKAEATLTLATVDDPSRYGVVEVDDDGAIVRFTEKPGKSSEVVNTINAGVYILEPSILDLIAADSTSSFEYDIFPEILARKLPFFAYVMKGEYWVDIGTPANYLKAHHDLLGRNVKGIEVDRAAASDVATRAEVDKVSIIGEGCSIKPGVQIKNSVIGPGVQVEEKAIIENSVIWAHTRVASAAEIDGAVIGRSCHIGRNSIVSPGTVLGDKTTLTDYTQV